MRRPVSLLAAVVPLLVAAGCGDGGLGPDRPAAAARPSANLAPADLDARISALILTLFPTGQEVAAASAQWTTIKRHLAEGRTAEARAKLGTLVVWMQGRESILTPPPGETARQALARLVVYMATYVYGGTVPEFPVGSDVGFGVILPNSDSPPIVTALGLAGLDPAPNAVAEPMVVVVSGDPNPDLTNYVACSGPLQTTRCQFPRFYKFDAYPHVKLLSPAKFAVCQLRVPGFPWPDHGFHDRLRLAHTRPANSSDYSPGAEQVEGIEILPYTDANFVACAPGYVPPTGAARPLLDRARTLLADAWSFVGPKTAWAFDLGGGGQGFAFSDFNAVDPLPRGSLSTAPDLTVASLAVNPTTVTAGTSVSLQFRIRNAGGYPNGRYATAVLLSSDEVLTPGADRELTRATGNNGLGSGSTADGGQGVTIPADLPAGFYWLGVFVDPDNAVAEAVETNNFRAIRIRVRRP
jgi:hypothetical protein